MSFIDRTYPDIVRDVLTNLTQGVAREVHRVTYDTTVRPIVVPDVVLLRRPVRRVSVVEGFIDGPTPSSEPIKYTFTLNDYELAPSANDPSDVSRIRFLPFGRKPASDTDLSVNYYPRTTDPTPLTDLNVGSVARTMLEAVSKELSLLYAQLNLAYDSAFLDTATGSSLDRVVALLGYSRFRAGRPVGSVTFSRRPGAIGNITIPAGTPITDTSDKIRYETVESAAMLRDEATAQIAIRGATANTPVVESGVLTVIQRSIAGVEKAINERPTTRASDDETDTELRARARDALLASNKGTVSALQHGLLQLPEVRDVKIVEMPNGVPGEISIAVSVEQPPADGSLPISVRDRIDELRPAGIRVIQALAAHVSLQLSVQLTLAGSRLASGVIEEIHRISKDKLEAEIKKRGVGEKIRNRSLAAAIMADERVADAEITIGVKGGAAGSPGADFQPESGVSVQLDTDDISFAADVFDQQTSPAEQVPVEVRARFAADALPGVQVDLQKELETRLKGFFAGVSAGTTIEHAAILTALRADTKYAIDPIKSRVNLTSGDQVFEITQGSSGFAVLAGQSFNVSSVEVIPLTSPSS